MRRQFQALRRKFPKLIVFFSILFNKRNETEAILLCGLYMVSMTLLKSTLGTQSPIE